MLINGTNNRLAAIKQQMKKPQKAPAMMQKPVQTPYAPPVPQTIGMQRQPQRQAQGQIEAAGPAQQMAPMPKPRDLGGSGNINVAAIDNTPGKKAPTPAGLVPAGQKPPMPSSNVGLMPGALQPVDRSQETMDQGINDFLRSLIEGAGNVDTSGAEDLIMKQIQDRLGEQQLDARASMGRAGFGSSGALYAMEGDQTRQAGMDTQAAILDERNRAEQAARDNAFKAIGAETGMRDSAQRQSLQEMLAEIMKTQSDSSIDAEKQRALAEKIAGKDPGGSMQPLDALSPASWIYGAATGGRSGTTDLWSAISKALGVK